MVAARYSTTLSIKLSATAAPACSNISQSHTHQRTCKDLIICNLRCSCSLAASAAVGPATAATMSLIARLDASPAALIARICAGSSFSIVFSTRESLLLGCVTTTLRASASRPAVRVSSCRQALDHRVQLAASTAGTNHTMRSTHAQCSPASAPAWQRQPVVRVLGAGAIRQNM